LFNYGVFIRVVKLAYTAGVKTVGGSVAHPGGFA
jgi:hypothetical protein